MRLWLTYILNQSNLAEDFIDDMRSRSNKLISMQNDAILEDDFDKAKRLALEANVYKTLANMAEKETRELRQQLEHNESTQ